MRKLATRVRLLPITIFAAVLMLSFKIGSIYEGFDGILDGPITIAGAEAQQADGTLPATPGAPPPAALGPEAPAAAPGDGEASAPESDSPDDVARRLVTEDPTLLTQAEIDLLQQLAERRDELERREQELEIQFGMLSAAEARIERRVAELQELQTVIEGLVQEHSRQEDVKLDSMVKIYENMKPKDAARIFEDLELEVLLLVAERMTERKLAPIMAEMNPQKAREMTVELTRQRQLPLPGGIVGG